MKLLLLLLTPLLLFSKVHYAKVEPFENLILKSAVSAQVTRANIRQEGTTVSGSIIKLDDKLDKIKLASSRASISSICRSVFLMSELCCSPLSTNSDRVVAIIGTVSKSVISVFENGTVTPLDVR